MRFAVACLGGRSVGRFDEAERLAALLVEPVFPIIDAEPVLHLEIGEMRLLEVFEPGTGHMVYIKVKRHDWTPHSASDIH